MIAMLMDLHTTIPNQKLELSLKTIDTVVAGA